MVKKQDQTSRKVRRLKSPVNSDDALRGEDLSDERRKYERYETALKVQFYVNFDLETKIDFRVKRQDKKIFSKLVQRAFQFRFSWKDSAKQYIALYEQCLSNHN